MSDAAIINIRNRGNGLADITFTFFADTDLTSENSFISEIEMFFGEDYCKAKREHTRGQIIITINTTQNRIEHFLKAPTNDYGHFMQCSLNQISNNYPIHKN